MSELEERIKEEIKYQKEVQFDDIAVYKLNKILKEVKALEAKFEECSTANADFQSEHKEFKQQLLKLKKLAVYYIQINPDFIGSQSDAEKELQDELNN